MYIRRGPDGHDEFAIEDMNEPLNNLPGGYKQPLLDLPYNN
jgi:hypothetical protein